MNAVLDSKLAIQSPGRWHDRLLDLAVYRRLGRLRAGVSRDVSFFYDGWSFPTPVDWIWLPRALAPRVRELVPLEIDDQRATSAPLDFGWRGELRENQAQAVLKVAAQEGGVLVAPPAAGKTHMGCWLVAAWGQRALWLVHTRALLDQAVERAQTVLALPRRGLGVIGAGREDWGTHLTIATVQELAKHAYPAEAEVGTVIVDEVHHYAGRTWASVVARLAARNRAGLTATARRADGLHGIVADQFGPAVEIGYRELVEQGYALLPTVCEVTTSFRASDGADWNRLQEERATDHWRNLGLCGLAAMEWGDGRRVVLLVERIEHTERLASTLRGQFGVPAQAVSGPVAALLRRQAFGALASQRHVLVATKLLDEGVDLPLADCLILGAAQRSEQLLWQRIGRVIRAPAGKKDAVVYDVQDPLVPALDDQGRERKALYRAMGFPVRRHSTAAA